MDAAALAGGDGARPAPARRRPGSAIRWRSARRRPGPEQRGDRGQHVLYPDAGDIRQGVGHGAQQRGPGPASATRTVAMCVCGACCSRPGLATRVKFSDRRLPGDVAQAGDLQIESRPSTLTRMVSPIWTPQPRGKAGVERHQRRAVVVGRPPVARRRCACRGAAWRRRSGRGRPAAPRPCRASPGPGRPARRSPRRCGPAGWAPARTSCTPGCAATRASNRGNWLFWISTKKKLGALAGSCSGDLSLHVALDQRDGGKGGQTEPDRDQHQRRRGAWPMQVAEAKPSGAAAEPRRAPRGQHQQRATEAEQRQRSRRPRAQNHSAKRRSCGSGDGQRDKAGRQHGGGKQNPERGARAAPAAARRGTARRRECARPGQAARARRRVPSAAHRRPRAASGPG